MCMSMCWIRMKRTSEINIVVRALRDTGMKAAIEQCAESATVSATAAGSDAVSLGQWMTKTSHLCCVVTDLANVPFSFTNITKG